jgi:hypothetical protein
MKLFELYTQVLSEDGDQYFYHGTPYVFDKFDMSKIGSGEGNAKFGYGFYFADNIETATWYAKELSIGDHRETGFNLYTVRLFQLDSFAHWENEIPSDIAECIMKKLMRMGETHTVELMQTEYEEYGEYWNMRNMYSILTDTLGSNKEASEFLNLCGMGGVIGQGHSGNIYTVFDDSLIKIIDVEKIQ